MSEDKQTTHTPVEDIRESLAAIQHDQWSGWMKYMFSKCTENLDGTYTIPEWAVFRWYDQIMTPYHRLTDKEQESDRIEADKILALFSSLLDELVMEELSHHNKSPKAEGYNIAVREFNQRIQSIQRAMKEETQ